MGESLSRMEVKVRPAQQNESSGSEMKLIVQNKEGDVY